MVQKQIITHFTDDDLYKLSMCCAVIDNFPRAQVKYEFVDRNKTVYPKGFAEEVRNQIELLENVVITDEEIAFMRRRCYFMPEWFYRYLYAQRCDVFGFGQHQMVDDSALFPPQRMCDGARELLCHRSHQRWKMGRKTE